MAAFGNDLHQLTATEMAASLPLYVEVRLETREISSFCCKCLNFKISFLSSHLVIKDRDRDLCLSNRDLCLFNVEAQ